MGPYSAEYLRMTLRLFNCFHCIIDAARPEPYHKKWVGLECMEVWDFDPNASRRMMQNEKRISLRHKPKEPAP